MTLGDTVIPSSVHKANSLHPTIVQTLKSLALAVPKIFQGAKNLK